MEQASMEPLLEPVLTYEVKLPQGCDKAVMLPKLRELEEEDPQLHVAWDEHLQEIQVQLMGEVQIEVLKNLISERFGAEVEFGRPNIVYKETITGPVEGVGHFEPLRHYAEVHLLLEPGERGSGLQFATGCSEDILDRNWQRLVMTHLEEKVHRGVLIGAPVTDMRITLVAEGPISNIRRAVISGRLLTGLSARALWRLTACFWNPGMIFAWRYLKQPLAGP